MKTEMIFQIYVSGAVVCAFVCGSCLLCTTHTHLTRNYICGHIYQEFIITAQYYIVFCHLMIYDFS